MVVVLEETQPLGLDMWVAWTVEAVTTLVRGLARLALRDCICASSETDFFWLGWGWEPTSKLPLDDTPPASLPTSPNLTPVSDGVLEQGGVG